MTATLSSSSKHTGNAKQNLMFDVVIVGGGMVGVTQALLFHYYLPQLSIALVDESTLTSTGRLYQPSYDARATALSRKSVLTFQKLGLWQTLAQQATPMHRVQVSDAGHSGRVEYAEDTSEPLGYVVENAWFGRTLLERLSQIPTIQRVEHSRVTHITQRANFAQFDLEAVKDSTTETRQMNQARTRLLVIADGAESPLRQQLGIHTSVHDYGQHAIVANVSFEKPHQCCAFERFRQNGPLALLPLGADGHAKKSALVWTHEHAQASEVMKLNSAEFAKRLQHAFGYQLGKFTQVGERASYPLKMVTAQEQMRKRIVLVGNAAHFLHPVAGQGFNLALRDCLKLVEVLKEASGKQAPDHTFDVGELCVLENYIDQQFGDQYLTIQLSHGFIKAFTSDSCAMQLGRQGALSAMNGLPWVKQQFFKQMMGTGIFG